MSEGLDLQFFGGLEADLPDLIKAQLPGQDHPAGSQVVPSGGRLVVDDAGLGRNVALDVGGVALGQSQGTHIGQDDGIHSHAVQILQPLREPGHLLIAGHGVAGHMDPHSLAVAQFHGGFQLFGGKIARKGAHTKHGTRQIDRVRSVGQSHLKPLHSSCRSQQFRFFHIGSPSRVQAPE